MRYGEESQQISLERLAHLINATREQLDKAAGIQSNADLDNYAADVRYEDTINQLFTLI